MPDVERTLRLPLDAEPEAEARPGPGAEARPGQGAEARPGQGAERAREAPRARWAPPGRLVELCAGPDAAQTSVAVMVLREAQTEGDPVAWVVPRGGGLFPPDLAAAGLDLDALVVVHVPPEDAAAAPKAAELILRTGAFGAVVLDLSRGMPPRGAAWQGRLLGLAREHRTRLLVLSPHGATRASLGPLVSLRWGVRRARSEAGRFCVESTALKDKSGLHASGSCASDVPSPCRAPSGVR